MREGMTRVNRKRQDGEKAMMIKEGKQKEESDCRGDEEKWAAGREGNVEGGEERNK